SDLVERYGLRATPPPEVKALQDKKSGITAQELKEQKKKEREQERADKKAQRNEEKAAAKKAQSTARKVKAAPPIVFPIEDERLPIVAPRVADLPDGRPVPARPIPCRDFGAVPPKFVTYLIQSWTFLTLYGKPLKLYPVNLDAFIYALSHQGQDPPATLLDEVFGTLIAIACDEWLSRTSATAAARGSTPATTADDALVAASSPPLAAAHSRYLRAFARLSDDERAAVDGWYHWHPGRWTKGGREGQRSSAGRPASAFGRFRAWEVALVGVLRDWVPARKFEDKWALLWALIGGEEHEGEVEENNLQMEEIVEPPVKPAESVEQPAHDPMQIEGDNEVAPPARATNGVGAEAAVANGKAAVHEDGGETAKETKNGVKIAAEGEGEEDELVKDESAVAEAGDENDDSSPPPVAGSSRRGRRRGVSAATTEASEDGNSAADSRVDDGHGDYDDPMDEDGDSDAVDDDDDDDYDELAQTSSRGSGASTGRRRSGRKPALSERARANAAQAAPRKRRRLRGSLDPDPDADYLRAPKPSSSSAPSRPSRGSTPADRPSRATVASSAASTSPDPVALTLRLLWFLVEECVGPSAMVRDTVDRALERIVENRKERRDLAKEFKDLAVQRSEAERQQRLLTARQSSEVEGETPGTEPGSEEAPSESGDSVEHGEEGPPRAKSRVEKLREDQARRDRESRLRASQSAQSRAQEKAYAKALRVHADALARIESLEYTLLVRQVSLDRLDAHLEALARMPSLGRDRARARYYYLDVALGAAPPGSGLEKSSLGKQNQASTDGGAEWMAGRLLVEEFEDGEDKWRVDVGDVEGVWGYYETVEELDTLKDWLDTRGIRERDLLAELVKSEDIIAASMVKRRTDMAAYLDPKPEAPAGRPKRITRQKDGDCGVDFLRYVNKWGDAAAGKGN
ncbi:hypothetical protein BDK51DRAFT_29577, partial [Blyttiomyces helicus]